MATRFSFLILVPTAIGVGLSLLSCLPGQAVEKARFSQPFRGPEYDLIAAAASEKGFWKENGLEVQWSYLRGDGLVFRAVVAGEIDLGLTQMVSIIQAISRANPVVAVADTGYFEDWVMWVRADSPVKDLKGLKGGTTGTSAFGGAAHAFTRAFLKGSNLERDVRIVAVGGLAERVAALKAGAITGFLLTSTPMLNLKVKGEVREMGSLKSLLPSPWQALSLFSHKKFATDRPLAVRGAIRAVLQAAEFIQKERAWSLEKLKALSGLTEAAAAMAYERLVYANRDGRIHRQAVENVLNFLVEYGIVARDKPPTVDDIFTNAFAR